MIEHRRLASGSLRSKQRDGTRPDRASGEDL